jgi:phosphate transport system permease protein
MQDAAAPASSSLLPDFHAPAAVRHRRLRHIKDVLTRWLMAFGGISVIIAITLIAFYLAWVVLPLFGAAKVEPVARYAEPGGPDAETLYYAGEEQREIGMRVTADGTVTFFRTADGSSVRTVAMLDGVDVELTAFGAGERSQTAFAFGLADGRAVVGRHVYALSYPDDVRVVTPSVVWPAGQAPIPLDTGSRPIVNIAVASRGEGATLVGATDDGRLLLLDITVEKSFLGDETSIREIRAELPPPEAPITHLLIDRLQRQVYAAAADGTISYYDVSRKAEPRLWHRVHAVPGGVRITAMEFLGGSVSVIVGDSRGHLNQWFPVRDENNNYTLEKIRGFTDQSAPITVIAPEYFRKGFAAADESGRVGLYHATAHRKVYLRSLSERPVRHLAFPPRANALLLSGDDGMLQVLHVHNEHPDVSMEAIWGKVWYENRQQPEWTWQSTSGTDDFEPKYSLTPLAFGTFKAAFYAMLFAIPLAILGAIYTGYFMSQRMRGYVKPTIEVMEALPTVILGFLAGLWLAPFVETHLPGIFVLLLTMPLSILAASYAWGRLPEQFRAAVADGWEAALLVPVVIATAWASVTLSAPLEVWLFGGNMPLWLTTELGIPYDQRNSMVVGFAMGFAVIPTIFSISEDAIYSAPKHLTTGSLALGATRWQTMVRVILLTASPGIFSAVMIGLGRAVGETMIVVMATGNTAIVDMNIFQGFRALSANIAVEMPESEVNSSHYRILFLAALVLFIVTFVFNTAAEVVRQRLRRKYSSL